MTVIRPGLAQSRSMNTGSRAPAGTPRSKIFGPNGPGACPGTGYGVGDGLAEAPADARAAGCVALTVGTGTRMGGGR